MKAAATKIEGCARDDDTSGMKDDARLSCPVCHFEREREIFFVCGKTVYAYERKREACLSRALGARCFIRQKKAIWEMILMHSFLFRYVSEPPPLRGTSFHRKEGVFQMHQTQKAIPFNGREWLQKWIRISRAGVVLHRGYTGW